MSEADTSRGTATSTGRHEPSGAPSFDLDLHADAMLADPCREIGRASCRERV